MRKKVIETVVYEFNEITELKPEYQNLVIQAQKVLKRAYAPYSGFRVGAAVLLENGKLVSGTNQENAAYPSGLCAERVALFYAGSEYPDVPVKAIAVAAAPDSEMLSSPVPPCGACRQVLLETETRFNRQIDIIMFGKEKIALVEGAQSLLPIRFSGEYLK